GKKTDANMFAGCEHAAIDLHRVDPGGDSFSGDVGANVVFICGEIVKNVWRSGDWQLGKQFARSKLLNIHTELGCECLHLLRALFSLE
ncbi:MAG: hypothetical protein LBI61_01785, partial [Puniceicoccales bacterium]|nr:hypothetical protein [Puniceicoccales bacterium]